MVNEILMRGATPIAPAQPVEAPQQAGVPASDAFSQTLLAELEGPAPAASRAGSAAPTLSAPQAITLETIPVQAPMMISPPPALPAAQAPSAAPAGGSYTVQAGDSLSKIARKMGHGNWRTLYAANRDTVGGNPNVIKPGQVLSLPSNWQAAHGASAAIAAAPQISARVAPVAAPPEAHAPISDAEIGTIASPASSLPPSATLEAGIETAPMGGPVSARMPAGQPTPTSMASEAIDRLTAEPAGSPDNVATLREALKSIPAGNASYDAYRAKVEAYESAVGAGPPIPGAIPGVALPAAPQPAGPAAFAPAPEGTYGPGAPVGAPMPAEPISAAPASPAIDAAAPAPAVVPAQAPEDAGDGNAEGEEGWQAFS